MAAYTRFPWTDTHLESPGRWLFPRGPIHSEDPGSPLCPASWHTWPWPGTPRLSSWPAWGYTAGPPSGSASAEDKGSDDEREPSSLVQEKQTWGDRFRSSEKQNVSLNNMCFQTLQHKCEKLWQIRQQILQTERELFKTAQYQPAQVRGFREMPIIYLWSAEQT